MSEHLSQQSCCADLLTRLFSTTFTSFLDDFSLCSCRARLLVSDKSISSSSSPSIRWKFKTTGNSSWCFGVVPEAALDDHDYLHVRGKVGFNSDKTSGGTLPKKM